MKLKKTIPVAMLASMIGASAWCGVAQANAYGLSIDRLKEGFVISNDATDVHITGLRNNTSAAAATVNGVGPATSDVGSGVKDTLQAKVGAVTAGENFYDNQGSISSLATFSRGDSRIEREQGTNATTAGTGILAQNIAESFVTGNNSATSAGNNSSGTLFTSEVIVTGSDITNNTLSFFFNLDPEMAVDLSPDAGAGSSATATLSFSFSLFPATGSTATSFFLWAPDGAETGGAGNIIGTGSPLELSDDENLNLSIQALTAGESKTYSPGESFGSFSATTGVLTPGTYTLTLAMGENASVVNTVPEPDSLALVGLGLMGFGIASSKRKRA